MGRGRGGSKPSAVFGSVHTPPLPKNKLIRVFSVYMNISLFSLSSTRRVTVRHLGLSRLGLNRLAVADDRGSCRPVDPNPNPPTLFLFVEDMHCTSFRTLDLFMGCTAGPARRCDMNKKRCQVRCATGAALQQQSGAARGQRQLRSQAGRSYGRTQHLLCDAKRLTGAMNRRRCAGTCTV